MKFWRTHIGRTMQRAALVAVSFFACAPAVYSAPVGGTTTGGSATISQSGTTTTITQGSDRAIIRWDQFDIGQQEHVQFVQPSASAIAVNRIRDSKPSQIDGRLSANGQVVLLNPNGVVFGKTATVDVNGLVASSADLADEDAFMNGGKLQLSRPGNADAAIVNHGQITVGEAGLVGLVAPHVENNGLIAARLGKVTLASGDVTTIDLAGDNLVKVEATDAVIAQSVKNSGTITAEGGTILLTAAQARGAVDALITHSGTLTADSVGGTTGHITLAAGAGTVQVSGTIAARGAQPNSKGGSVQVTATRIALSSSAVVDASGTAGGGTVRVGGDYQGGGSLPKARYTSVAKGAVLKANATEQGDAGSIVVWSDEATRFAGHAEATSRTGRGGLIEVSGKNYLNFNGTVALAGATGAGSLLLDPTNLTISNGVDTDVTGTSPFEPVADDASSVLNASTLLAALASGDVIVQTRSTGSQLGDIFVNAALSWVSGHSLTLSAHHQIVVNAPINAGSGNLTLHAQDVQLNANLAGTGRLHFLPLTDNISLGIGNGAVGTYLVDSTELGRLTNGWSELLFGRADSTAAIDLRAASWNDALALQTGSGTIAVNGAQAMGANDLTLTTNGDLALNAALTGTGTLSIQTASTAGTIGLGDAQAGGLQLSNAELGRITDGWSLIRMGRTDSTGAVNIGALSWNDALTLQAGSGGININGTQTMGANPLILSSDGDISLLGNLTGSGSLTVQTATAAGTMGLGNAQAGGLALDDAELARITDGWASLVFGRVDGTGTTNLGALSWNDALTLQSGSSGVININGTQTMGGNTLTLASDGDVNLVGNLTGTGNLYLQGATVASTIGLGNGQTGGLQLDATEMGRITDGWATIYVGRTNGTGTTNLGALSWNDALTLQSGSSGVININGTQTMGANTLTLASDGDVNLVGNLTGTGNLYLQGTTAASAIGLGNGQAGGLQLDATEMSRITNGWSNIYVGRTDGTGVINLGALTWNDFLTLQSGSGVININGTQTMGANTLTLASDGDVNLVGNLTGTGNLYLQGASASSAIGLGNGQTGGLTLDTAEMGRITNGWGNIYVGRTDGTGAINLGVITWNDFLTLQSDTGVIGIYGGQTMGANSITFVTNADIALNGAVTGSTTFTVTPNAIGTSIGLGNAQTGTINLDAAEIARITNGWASLVFGRIDGTGAINVGALTFNDVLTLQNAGGAMNINGTLTMGGNNLTLRTNTDLAINGNLTGTGTLSIFQNNSNVSMGIGTGQAGALNLDSTELGRITNGWGNLVFGRTDGTAALNVGAASWNDNVTFRTGSGALNINGAQNLAGNNLTISTDANLAVNAALTGTGTLAIGPSNNATSMGLAGAAGTLNIDTAELTNITNGWTTLIFGNTTQTGNISINAATWNDNFSLRTNTGVITINGTQALGANNLNIATSADLVLNGALTGTGTLTIQGQNNATTLGIGDGMVGTLNMTNAELANITDGWSTLVFGTTSQTGAMNIGTYSWNDPVRLSTNSGVITIHGTQNMGANALSILTDSNLALNGALTGTGTLTIRNAANGTSMGLAGGAGTLNLTSAELANITDGWANLIFGQTSQSGAMNVGAYSWTDAVNFITGSGVITISGAQQLGANNFGIQTSANPVIGANLSGTGFFVLQGAASTTTMGLGTGQAGTIQLTDTEISYIADGWSGIQFGNSGQTGVLNVGERTWLDPITFRTNTGAINFNGTQRMDNNTLTILTNSNLALTNNLVGTGTLNIAPSTTSTTMGIAGGAGTLNLDATDLSYISDGWSNIQFGNNTQTGNITVNAASWNDNVTFMSSTGIITIAGAQTMGANNLTLNSSVDPVINAALTGSGTLTLAPSANNITVGIGGGAGTFNISTAEIARLTDGWAQIILGRSDSSGAVTVNATSWNDPLTIQSGSGALTIAGAQTMGANNLTLITNSNLALSAALTGTGTLTIAPATASTSIGLAGGAGTLALTTAELTNITNGWGDIIIGSSTGSGAMAVNAATWNDNLTLRTGSGTLTISGTQTMGANNLTLQTDSNLALNGDLSGTGNLTIRGSSSATGIGIGNGQAGALALVNTELARILTGWNQVMFGSELQTGAINIGTNSWANATHFVTRGNIVLNGAQTSTKTSGTTLVFATTQGAFINNAGASAITTSGTGRYLVYSVDAANDTLGGLTRPTIVTNKTYAAYGPALVTESGNVYIYAGAVPKVIYLSIDNKNKEYGGNLPLLTYTYLSGLQGNDTLTDAILSYTLSVLGNSALDNAGTTRAITGNFTTGLGYTVNVTDGVLTVTKATINVQVNNQTRAYGDANPALSLTYLGFRNGDDVADLDTLAAAGASGANAFSPVGTYAITSAGGAADANYNFTYSSGTLTITKAALTITVDDMSRTYGAANPIFTYSYSGLKNGEDGSVLDNAPTASTTANALSNVGTYAITGSAGLDDNYTITVVNGTLTVTPATVTVTADNKTRTYGAGNPALTLQYAGFVNGQDSSVLTTLPTLSTLATLASNTGTYSITASGAAASNYSFAYVDGTLTITKATLTATAGNGTRTYGAANPVFGVTYSGFVNGEDSSVIDTLATASSAANALSNVGTYAVTASGASDGNYDFTYNPGTLTITKATLTATAGNGTRTYGAANPVFGVTYSGFVNGEDSSVIDTLASASSAANSLSNVGTYAVTASGANDGNYDFTYSPGTLTITKATLTATAGNGTRTYGASNPAFGVTYSGFVNGEDSSVIDTLASASSAANALSNVGTYAVTASGASDGNYDFTYSPGTLTITKATLTATAGNGTRTYGAANPVFGVTYSGFVNGEDSSVIDTLASASTAANGLSDVGTYAVTASGANDGNYDFTYSPGTLTITKATLTATAGNGTRTYGAANPVFGVTYSGFVNGEDSSVIDTLATASTAANALSNVGTYAVTASGAADGNYDFTYVDGALTITKATLTATAGNGTRTYGAANPAFGVTYSGFVNGEDSSVIDTLATASTAANALSNVGTYAVTASGAADGNYDFTYSPGTLTITKATLTATAGNGTRTYGAANPVFGVTYSGFVNGEDSSVIDTLATAGTAANSLSNVGTYAVTASGANDGNYSFAYVDGALTITKATLTATAGNGTRTYGAANPAFGVTYSGFVNGEDSSVIDTLATASTAATALSNVGTYAVTASGANDNNYDFTYSTGTVTITKATLTATAGNGTRTYGAANPVFGVTYSGFVNGEDSSVIDTLATASTAANSLSNVGTYAVTASGANDGNYDFTYSPGTLTITKATLTATAGNGTRTYGAANPAFGVTYSGFVNGEDSSVIDTLATASSAANALSNVGTYAVTASGANDGNYDFTYNPGTLTITKATLTTTAGNGTRTYGAANPVFGVTYSGFVNGEDSSVIDTLATASTAATALSNVGTYAVTASGANDNNYDFTYNPGTLTITKATLTATAGNGTRTYGAANPAFGVTYSGFVNGEDSSVIDTLATASSAANALSNVGTYAVTASGASDGNYDFTYNPGTLTITKATLTATAGNGTRTYGAANPVFGVTYSGFVNGEDSSVIDTLATASTAATALSNVGTYAVTASGANDNNYDFTYNPGTLTITKATLTATADAKTRYINEANPSFTFTYTGFVNGENSAVIDTLATASTTATVGSPAGSYAITGSGATDGNYNFTYQNGVLTVLAGVVPTPTPTPTPSTDLPPTSEQPDPTRYFAARDFNQATQRPTPTGDSGDIVVISGSDIEVDTFANPFLIAITDELSQQTYGSTTNMFTRFTPMNLYIEREQKRKKRRVAQWF